MGRGLANTLVMLCVLVLAGPAWSAPLVFVADEFPPFSFKEDGEVRGVNTDIIRAVFHELGQSVRFEILPTKRAMYMADAGKCAGVYTLTRSPERERVLLFSTPICKVTDVFFKRKGDSSATVIYAPKTGYALFHLNVSNPINDMSAMFPV